MMARTTGWGGRLAGAALATGLVLAGTARAEVTDEMEARAVSALKRGVRSGDFSARATAVAGLGHVPRAEKKEALKLVKAALEDPQWQVRRAAIEALLELKDRSWKEALVEAVRSPRLDPEDEVLPLLGPLDTRQAVAVLDKGLSGEKVPNAAAWADALAEHGGELMVEAYEDALRSRNAEVRKAFAEKLPELPLEDAVPLYRGTLHDQPAEVQLRVIERVTDGAALEDRDFLERLLREKDPEVRLRAAAALARTGNPKGKSILVKAAKGDDPERRLVALRALEGIASKDLFDVAKPIVMNPEARIEELRAAYAIYAAVGHPNLAKHLEKRMLSTDIERRAAAVRVIGSIEGRDGLERLHRLLGDGSRLVRKQAALAVGDLASPQSIGPLRRRLANETDPEVKLALIESLERIRTPEIVPVLQQFLYEPTEEVRLAVLDALEAVHHPSTEPLLDLLLSDRSPKVRRGALLALLDLGPEGQLDTFQQSLTWIPPESLEPLVKEHGEEMLPHLKLAVRSEREDLREAAADALVLLPERLQSDVYEDLVRKARRPAMRVAGIEGLVETRGKGARDLLVELTSKDEDLAVRVAAIHALGHVGGKDLAPRLFELTDDLHEEVRIAASASLLHL
ncbi:MAG: HEAT repeat domain-containing protein [Myxococcota bacterium]